MRNIRERVVRILTVVMFAVAFQCADAQQLTFDFQRFIQTLFNFNTEMDETIKQTGLLLDNVDHTHRMYERWQKAAKKLSEVSEYIGRVEDIEEMYNMIQETISLLEYGKTVIMDDNYLNVSRKLWYLNTVIETTTDNIIHLQEMIARYSPGSTAGGNMDDGQREELKEEDKKIARNNINSAKGMLKELKMNTAYRIYDGRLYSGAMSAIGGF